MLGVGWTARSVIAWYVGRRIINYPRLLRPDLELPVHSEQTEVDVVLLGCPFKPGTGSRRVSRKMAFDGFSLNVHLAFNLEVATIFQLAWTVSAPFQLLSCQWRQLPWPAASQSSIGFRSKRWHLLRCEWKEA